MKKGFRLKNGSDCNFWMYLFPSLHIFVNFSIKRAWHHCGLMPRPISKLLLCEDFGRTRTCANARNFLLVHNPQNLINPRKNPNPNFWGSGSWFHLIKFQVSWVRHQKTREIRVGFRVFSGFCTLYLEPRVIPRWLRWCTACEEWLAKRASQYLHLWGFSPVQVNLVKSSYSCIN